MITNKETKYMVLTISAVSLMVVCSLLVEFNIEDVLYLLFITIALVKYAIIEYKK